MRCTPESLNPRLLTPAIYPVAEDGGHKLALRVDP
jgi:hypothetical protein